MTELTEVPNFRPADRITNPALFELARKRFPGHRITSEMLRDAAALTDTPLFVQATRENVEAGLAEISRDRAALTTKG